MLDYIALSFTHTLISDLNITSRILLECQYRHFTLANSHWYRRQRRISGALGSGVPQVKCVSNMLSCLETGMFPDH